MHILWNTTMKISNSWHITQNNIWKIHQAASPTRRSPRAWCSSWWRKCACKRNSPQWVGPAHAQKSRRHRSQLIGLANRRPYSKTTWTTSFLNSPMGSCFSCKKATASFTMTVRDFEPSIFQWITTLPLVLLLSALMTSWSCLSDIKHIVLGCVRRRSFFLARIDLTSGATNYCIWLHVNPWDM